MDARNMIESSFYIAAGVLLVVLNVPMGMVIVASKQLRITFGVLGALFAAGAVTGICAVAKGISWLHVPDAKGLRNTTIGGLFCATKPAVILDLFSFQSIALLLAVNSFDRLLVVYLPIEYFKRAKRTVTLEVSLALLVLFIVQLFTMIDVTVEGRKVTTVTCRLSEFLPPLAYSANIYFRLFNSLASIVLMAFVLLKLDYHVGKSIDTKKDWNVQRYVTNQNNFTKAMLFSCCFTLLLDTIPTCTLVYAYLAALADYNELVLCARIACMFNAVNMVIVVTCRPTEIRERLLQYMRKWILPRQRVVVVTARCAAVSTRNFATMISST